MSDRITQRRPTISSTSTPETHREPPHPIPIEHVDPDALKVVRRLKRYGHTAYLVGGCVRDLLLGRTPKDFDVGTSARPRQVKHLFRNSRIIGRRFRLAHIVFGRKVIEVATFRATQEPPELPENLDGDAPEEANPNTPSQPRAAAPRPDDDEDLLIRSDNVFGTPEQDAFRRDFTVNGLFYDPETAQVIDHVGGMVDLERRVLRTIGDPDVRFREDPVRIVRAVKFAARLHFAIEPRTFDAMIRNRGELTKAAKPRLAEEVIRLAQGGAGAESFRLLDDLGVLQYIAPAVGESLARANAAQTRPIDAGPGGLFWKHLEAIDRWPRGPGDLSRATVLACVYGPVFREAMATPQAQRDPGAAFFHAIRPAISDRLLSRREADRIKLIYVAQRRLESPPGPGDQQAAPQQGQQQGGRGGDGGRGRRRRRRGGGGKGLVGRDYFREAVAFFRLDATARGKSPDVWTQWEALLPQAPPVREVLPFRRRAEEAMASTHHELPDDEPMPTAEEIDALNRLPDDEEFGRHRRRRGGRLSENARERERMDTTQPSPQVPPRAPAAPPEWSKTDVTGAPSGREIWRSDDKDATPVAPLLGEDGKPLPRLAKPKRARERQPVEVTPPVPMAPPPPKLTPSERISRAMFSDDGLINPYTGRKYVPRKVFDEVPQPSLAPAPMAAAGAMETVPSVPYTLDEFEPPTDEKRVSRSVEAPPSPVAKESRSSERSPEPKPKREGQPASSTPSGGSEAAPGGDGRRRRRRRGRRGRGGRGRGPGGAPGGSTPPAGSPPAGGGSGNAS